MTDITIPHVTGVESYSLDHLADAHNMLAAAARTVSNVRTTIIQILIQVRNKELFKEGINQETGETFKTFAEYLAYSAALIESVADYGVETIMKLMSEVLIHEQAVMLLGVGKEEAETLVDELGSHRQKLLPAARVENYQLLDEGVELDNGTKKLGAADFSDLVEYILIMLGMRPLKADTQERWAKPDEFLIDTVGDESYVVPGQWQVSDTQAEVNKLRGRSDVRRAVEIHVTQNSVGEIFIKTIRLLRDGVWVESPLNLDDFKTMVKAMKLKVVGMPEGWEN